MIIVRIWEGLGNQLFQYAYARSLELRTGQRVYFDVDRCFSNELEGKRTIREYQLCYLHTKMQKYSKAEKLFFFLKQRNFLEQIIFILAQRKYSPIKFIKEHDVSYKEELRQVSGIIYLMGWFQNENYFKEYRDILLKELRPKKKIRISPELKNVLRECNTVSIHIRRGDYKKWNYMLPISYYERAMIYLKDKVDNPVFLVFSDDVTWVKENIDFGERAIFVSVTEKLEDYEEMFLMSKCKHNIIANSTFSWWGAWLNTNADKIVIGPRHWFGSKGVNAGYNIMPSEWIKM